MTSSFRATSAWGAAAKGISPLAAAALAVAFCAVVTGCAGGSNAEADRFIRESNRHLARAAEEVGNLKEFNAGWQSLLTGRAGEETARQVRELLEKARKSEEVALAEVKAAGKAVTAIKEQSVSSEMKTYADMKLEALEEQERFLGTELEAMDMRLSAISSLLEGATLESVLTMEKRIDSLELEAGEQAKTASELHEKANAYFKEKKLGR